MDSSPLLSLFILLTFSCIPPTHSDPSALTSTPIPSPSPTSLPPPPPPPSQANLSPLRPSIIVIVTILSSIFGITFILLLYAKHCSHSGGPPVAAPGGYPSAPAVGRKNSGIDRAVVESLPIFRFASLKGKKDGLKCVVCLASFEPTEALRLLPKCGHAFHVECVDAWLDAHSTCPLCRYRVDPEDILIPGRDVIIPIGHDDHESIASASATATASASASTSVSTAAGGRTRRVSGRHSFAGERARAFGDSIRSVFAFRRSFDGNGAATSRKDGMLRTADDGEEERLWRKMREDRKVEHRIVVSDGKGLNERWSDIQPSDLLYLESRKMMSEGNYRIGGRSRREEDERRRVMNARSASAIAGIGRHDGFVGDAPLSTRSRSLTGDGSGNVVRSSRRPVRLANNSCALVG